jgi:hypothetical protein
MEFVFEIILVWVVINLVVLAIVVEKDFRRIQSRSRGRKSEPPILERKKGSSSQVDITGALNE